MNGRLFESKPPSKRLQTREKRLGEDRVEALRNIESFRLDGCRTVVEGLVFLENLLSLSDGSFAPYEDVAHQEQIPWIDPPCVVYSKGQHTGD